MCWSPGTELPVNLPLHSGPGVRAEDGSDINKTIAAYAPIGCRILGNAILPALNKSLSVSQRELLSKITASAISAAGLTTR